MADGLFDTQASSGLTPTTGQGGFYFDSATGLFVSKDATNRAYGYTRNASIAAQTVSAADTYLTDSDLLIPSFGAQARARFKWTVSASKTGAGVATPIYNIRIGLNRTTSDSPRLVLTGPAQTAIADIGTLTVWATMRLIGASGVLQGTAEWNHRGTAASTTVSGTGFANDVTGHVEGTSAGFDNTALSQLYIGLSVNSGTLGIWTVTQVWAEAWW